MRTFRGALDKNLNIAHSKENGINEGNSLEKKTKKEFMTE
jgi:hypothetical protein